MADRSRDGRVLVGAVVLLVLAAALTAIRGPVVLASLATAAILVAGVVGVLPLLRRDDLDWDWVPEEAAEVPPEPGIAALRTTLDPHERDTGAAERLHTLVAAIARERGATGALPEGGSGPLSTYLAAPPRRLSLDEAEAVVTELETLSPTKETP